MSQSKHCPRCDTTKPCSEFGPSKSTGDGLFPYCRDCKRAADRQSHADHRPARLAKMHRYYHGE